MLAPCRCAEVRYYGSLTLSALFLQEKAGWADASASARRFFVLLWAMTTIREPITIAKPLEDVAAYVSDPLHLPEWNQLIARVLDVRPTPQVVGTTWKLLVQVAGREQEVIARVHVYAPPTRFGFELVGGAGIPGLTSRMLLEAEPGGADEQAQATTRLTCALEIGFPLLMGGPALGKVMTPIIREQLRQGLEQLKKVLEHSLTS
jgi:uncharacterized membrane protein